MSWEIRIHPAGTPRGHWEPFARYPLRADALHWLHILRRQYPHAGFVLEQADAGGPLFTETGKPVPYPDGQVPR